MELVSLVSQQRGSMAIRSVPSRRDLFYSLSNVCATRFILQPNVSAAAASSIPSTEELSRLLWVTPACDIGSIIGMSDVERKQVIRTEGGAGGNLCTKTPLRVQEFMGYKSTTDPRYKIDKLLVRAGPLVDPSDFEDYLDAVEQYRTTADATALLAYTSSWGEANQSKAATFFVSRFLLA